MFNQLDRRHFLGTATASGIAASTLLAGRTPAQDSSANEKIVVGVMGLSRGRSLAVNFAQQPNVEVKYVCDVDQTRAESGAQVVQGAVEKAPQVISDFRKILDDKEVDALVCAAPNHWHAPATILACNAGKHVYVEKPCSHNPQEGEWMVEAARKHNRAVQMGTQRRSGPGTIAAMQKLHDGAIGRVYASRAWYTNLRGPVHRVDPSNPPPSLDYELWQGPAPRMPFKTNVVHYNWHWHWHWGNGELGNNGVHTLDLCRWGLGVDYPIRVTSAGGRYRYDDAQETPDTHNVNFEFDSQQTICWQGLSCNKHGGGFVSFYGEEGSLELDSNGEHRVYDRNDKLVEETKSSSLGDIEHIANFIAAIRADKPLSLNAEIEKGHKSTMLCHLGNIAHRTGNTLNCDPKNGHILHDELAAKLWQREYADGWQPRV
jgi:predicted dehydrogenase